MQIVGTSMQHIFDNMHHVKRFEQSLFVFEDILFRTTINVLHLLKDGKLEVYK